MPGELPIASHVALNFVLTIRILGQLKVAEGPIPGLPVPLLEQDH